MFRTIVFVLAAVSGITAEEIRTVELKHTVPNQYQALDAFNIHHKGQGNLLVLRGIPESVKAAEAFIARFDVPRKSVEATLHILSATTQAGGDKLPSDLEPVAKQIRNNFVYQGFKLLESVVLRSREGGEGRAGGTLPGPADTPRRTYNIQFGNVSISPAEKSNLIRFDRFQFEVRSVDSVASKLNSKLEYNRANLAADIDVREGQRVVVGKANMEGIDGPFFLVITARVVD